MKIINIEKFEIENVGFKIELKDWKDFVNLAEKYFDEVNNEWKRDEDRIVFFDGRIYYMISEEDLFFIKAKEK